MNVVGYIRVSTQGQARDGYSLKYQEEEIKAYCEEHGFNLTNIFRDEGITASLWRNPSHLYTRTYIQSHQSIFKTKQDTGRGRCFNINRRQIKRAGTANYAGYGPSS
ncbi:hypothetical protein CU633_18430 [Bacillus sp. V3-13]|nr:hypothetical protein CU633_18430 [Bacillus sp. V3-13]